MTYIRAVSMVLCILLCGCTTMLRSTNTATESTQDRALKGGVVYYLPAAGFEVAMPLRIVSCRMDGDTPRFQYDVSPAEIKQRFVADTTHAYILEYPLLNSTFKVTTANIALYPNGMIKSVNADIDDRTAQVLASLGGAAVNLAKAVAFGGFVPFSGTAVKVCPKFVTDKIEKFDQLDRERRIATAADTELESKKGELVKAKTAQEQADAALKAAPKDASKEDLAKLKAAAEEAKAKVAKLTGEIGDAKPKLPAIEKQYRAVAAQVVSRPTKFWIPSLDKRCEAFSVDAPVAAKALFDPGELGEDDQKAFEKFLTDVDRFDKLTATICVAGQFPSAKTDVEAAQINGLYYRMPVSASLEVRKGDEKQPIIFFGETPVSLPQFGIKAVLPLENKIFDKNQLKATFQEDGSLATLDFVAQSQAERGSAAVQELTKLYGDYLSELQKSRLKLETDKDEATKRERDREISALDAKITEIKKIRDLEVTRAGIQDRFTLQKDVATREEEALQAQIKLEQARKQLQKLRESP